MQTCCIVCWLIVVYFVATSMATWRPYDEGRHHDWSVQFLAPSRKCCTSTATTYHATMMCQIRGRKEATNLTWRLTRQQLQCQLPWLVGACLLAHKTSKNMHHNNPTTPSTYHELNGKQWLPWCPTPNAATYNSHQAYWLIILCSSAGSEAPWRHWDNGGHHGWWGSILKKYARRYLYLTFQPSGWSI